MAMAEKILQRMEQHCATYDKEVKRKKLDDIDSPFAKKLASTMHQCSVQRAAQFGGKLTGDAAGRLFAQHDTFAEGGQAREYGKGKKKTTIGGDHYEIIKQSLKQLHYITKLISRPTPLCDHEVNVLVKLVTSFAMCG